MSISKEEHEQQVEKDQVDQKTQEVEKQEELQEAVEADSTTRSSEDTHQFHSPLNSNAIITITTSEPIDIQPLLIQHQGQFQLLSTTPPHIKLKFMDKTQAQDFQTQFNSKYPNLEIEIEFDALTHPGNIYVRGLGPEITTEDLYKIFEPFGEITSSKIVNDDYGRSKGYGFINYSNGASADEAIDKLNGLLVNGSKLYLNHHIAKKERIQRIDFEKSNFTNLYIKNLPIDYTLEQFESLFKKFGEISSSFLPDLQDPEQQQNQGSLSPPVQKRFGFINFKNHESAINAIESLNDSEIAPGQFLSVSRAQRRDERNEHYNHQHHPYAPNPYGQFQIRNNSISPQPAPILFQSPPITAPGSVPPPGIITSPILQANSISIPNSNLSNNLGIPRSTPPHSIESITSPNFLPNQIIQQVTPSIPSGPTATSIPPTTGSGAPSATTTIPFPIPGPNHQPSNLYVRNLTPTIDDSALHSAFAPFGIIVSAKIMTTDDGESRGYGFVCYRTSPEASRALIAMNGNVLDGQMLHVSFAQKNNKKKFGKQMGGPGPHPSMANGPSPPQYYYNNPYQDPNAYPQFYNPQAGAPTGGNGGYGNGYRSYYNGYKPYKQHHNQQQQSGYNYGGSNVGAQANHVDGANNQGASNGKESNDKIVKLTSEILALNNEDDKISKISKFLIVPKLLNLGDDPKIVEEKSISFIKTQIEKSQQDNKENDDVNAENNIYLDFINDWVNDEESLIKELEELSF